MAAPYSFERDFDADSFTVNPEPFDVGGRFGLVLQAGACLFLLSTCTAMVGKSSDKSFGLVLLLICLAVCAVMFFIPYRRFKRLQRENAQERRQVKIHVGDTDLRVGDSGPDQVVIPYENLHRLVVRNSLEGEYVGASTGGFVLAGGSGALGAASMATTGVLAGAANIAARAHATRLGKYSKVCFQVLAEASGESFPLAQGMTEAGANGLMNDLAKTVQERQRG